MTSELPELPRVSALDGATFESVVLTYFVYETCPRRHLEWSVSQRHLLSRFNRSGQRRMSGYFSRATEKGFVKKIRKSRGVRPDVFKRGDFFTHRSHQGDLCIRLSNSLYAKDRGLLHDWPYPNAWGHGCLHPGEILCLATLRRLGRPVIRNEVQRYLSALVPPQSFDGCIKKLRSKGLIQLDGSVISLVPDWEAVTHRYLEDNPACNERKRKGDVRRRQESEQNRRRATRGILTDAERQELRSLRCVRKGCRKKATQMEHFPPKRYLADLDEVHNPYLVWAICPEHNVETSEFIKTLGPISINSIPLFHSVGDTDPFLLYRLVSNHWYGEFYKAFLIGDREAAERAIRITLSYWLAIKDLPRPTNGDTPLSLRMKHIAKLGRRYSTWKSQLS